MDLFVVSSGNLVMAFDIGTFFSNLTAKAQTWGGYFLMFLGVLLIIVGGFQIAKGFMSHGRGQVNWLMAIGTIMVGGFLAAKGFTGLNTLSGIGAETINALGSSSGTSSTT